ncbi:CBS domain-containing protein [Sneathiella sp. P13V-1]|uniref:CBS domain-containing protein n=1 Tax=Sneathiella sp. P13V-1 TaxID=2697366 RepID=UPI00187B4D62|nr:CBS domain-containing protein [Sneathiella sp. P13V-1]MBE7638445.1 CBS domain-containing protein [Sneathiella sp. P13V-1]
MSVAGILKTKGTTIITAKVGDSVSVASAILADHNIGAVLVLDSVGQVAGILSERDIVAALARSGSGCLIVNVEDLMTRNVIVCKPSDSIDDILLMMTEKRIRHLPVMDDSKLLGVISIGDVVKHRMDAVEQEAAAMRDYIATG